MRACRRCNAAPRAGLFLSLSRALSLSLFLNVCVYTFVCPHLPSRVTPFSNCVSLHADRHSIMRRTTLSAPLKYAFNLHRASILIDFLGESVLVKIFVGKNLINDRVSRALVNVNVPPLRGKLDHFCQRFID